MSYPWNPGDALHLLRDWRLIKRACSPRNPAFAQADARTKDAHGKRVHEHFAGSAAEQAHSRATNLQALVVGGFHKFVKALNEEPVRLAPIPRSGRKPRLVAVPTFLRRCTSNLLNEVLTLTCNHKLPASVRAYRKGDAGAVREAILDVAEAVVDKKLVYYVKLDISNYFPSMPWDLIEEALLHYGFKPEFVEYVLTAVRCPLVTWNKGHLCAVRNTKGAQMGLAESSFLANVVPFEIDEYVASRGQRLFYIRYCDDLIVGSPYQHEVVGAVRFIQRWCRKHGFRLKGVSPDVHPRKLVQDVRRRRVDFLGAEIDQIGIVHMPKAKLEEKLAKLEDVAEKLVKPDELAHGHVFGVSRYGDGDGANRYDMDDIHRSSESFVDYWMQLDEAEARRVDGIIKRRFPRHPAPSGAGCGTVWSCQLWADQAVNGAETKNPEHLNQSVQPGHRPPEASGPPSQAAGTSTTDRTDRPTNPRQTDGPPEGSGKRGRNQEGCDGSGPHESSFSYEDLLEEDDDEWEEHTDVQTDVMEENDASYTDEVEAEDFSSEDTCPRSSTGSHSHRFHSPSGEREDLSDLLDVGDLVDQEDLSDLGGAEGDTADEGDLFGQGGESPASPCFENIPSVHVLVRATRGAAPGAIVALLPTTNSVPVRIRRFERCRPETALVLTLTDIARTARREGHRGVHFRLEEAWLPKSLLQPHRTFRAPLLFAHVLHLHEEVRLSGVKVVISGGVKAPAALRRVLEQAVADFAYERECGKRDPRTRAGVA